MEELDSTTQYRKNKKPKLGFGFQSTEQIVQSNNSKTILPTMSQTSAHG